MTYGTVTTPPLNDAERKLVEDNINLVWFFVNRLGERDEEEKQERFCDGVFGLMRAAQKFDPDLGYAFSTYASAWIRSRVDRGRMRREGNNVKRARQTGDRYILLSLDRALNMDDGTFEQGGAFGDSLADESCDVEADALTSSSLETAARQLFDDLDAIDRDILTSLLSGELLHGTTKKAADERIAERHGYSMNGIRNRREAVTRRLRGAMA